MPVSLAGLPLLDPAVEKDNCDRFGVDTSSWWGLANSFRVPLRWNPDGTMCGRGTVLMHSRHFQRLLADADLDDVELAFEDARGNRIAFTHLSVVESERTPIGDKADQAAAVVVTLADRRFRLCQVPVDRAYNTLDAAGDYEADSLDDADEPWTWDTLVEDLWAKMYAVYPDIGVDPPEFPSMPDGEPEGFYFTGPGTNAWASLDRVAEAAGYFLRFDPTTNTADFVAVDAAYDDVVPTANEERLRITDTGLVAPSEPRLPETVRVSFPVPGENWRHYEEVTVGGTVTGTAAAAADDCAAVLAGADPTGNLAIRAANVAAVWVWDFMARNNPRFAEFAGVCDYVRRVCGHPYFAAWSVQDSVTGDGRRSGVISACATGRVWQDREELRLAPGGAIITANVDATEESTTTRLEFNQDTYVRVDAGATDADPDVVSIDTAGLCADAAFADCVRDSMTFDVPVDLVTNVCVTVTLTKTFADTQLGGQNVLRDVSAAVSVFLEKKTVTMLGGTTVGPAVCSLAPTECCVPPVETECCPGYMVPTILCATFTAGPNAGTEVTLTYDAGAWRGGSVDLSCLGSPDDWYIQVDFDAGGPSVANCDPLYLEATVGAHTLIITEGACV
jgi:hypothetical protein